VAWTLVDSLSSPTAGAFTFPSLTLSSYSTVQIVITGVTVTTDGTDIALTFYVGGVEITATYRWGQASGSSAAATNADGDVSDPSILLTSNDPNWDVGNASGEGFGAIVTVDEPTSTALYKKAGYVSVFTGPTGTMIEALGIGIMENTGAINGLKVAGTSSLTAGKVRILGWA
jgi:hypothetical protein